MSHSKSSGLIAYFVKHPVASQLMMFVVLILGGFATFSLNSQLLPSFHVPVIFAEVFGLAPVPTLLISWPSFQLSKY